MKEALATSILLAHPDPEATLAVFVDASNQKLQQKENSIWQSLEFYYKKLTKNKSIWSPYDCEMYYIYQAIKHFGFLLEGRIFVLYTDHKPLT